MGSGGHVDSLIIIRRMFRIVARRIGPLVGCLAAREANQTLPRTHKHRPVQTNILCRRDASNAFMHRWLRGRRQVRCVALSWAALRSDMNRSTGHSVSPFTAS
jgi:hypothetical protein